MLSSGQGTAIVNMTSQQLGAPALHPGRLSQSIIDEGGAHGTLSLLVKLLDSGERQSYRQLYTKGWTQTVLVKISG